MKLTPWFLASIHKPVRVGVYEVEYLGWSKWDGKQWCMAFDLASHAAKSTMRSELMYGPGAKWRGLEYEIWTGKGKD